MRFLVDKLLKEIRQAANLVRAKKRVSVSPDEADNRFLECPEAAHADFLVTGQTHEMASTPWA